jgi:glycosyltransferase involved in cell wall biosynthesis
MNVSICMITYNQEKYISHAIEGVISQSVNFEMELIIGEDCSTDSTRAICLKYQNKYPSLITLLPSSKNVGMNQNFIRTLHACKGEYIAICEGDDYWTNSSKLKKQIEFLDKQVNFSLCFHRANKIKLGEKIASSFENIESREYVGEELLTTVFIPTASVVFRNYHNEDYSFMINKNIIYPDIFLWLRLVSRGKIFCLSENMSVYRIQENSVTNVVYSKENIEKIINNFKILNFTFNFKYDKIVNSIVSKNYIKISKIGLKKGKVISSKYLILSAIYYIKSIFKKRIIN